MESETKQGNKIRSLPVLNEASKLNRSCVKQGQGLKDLATHLYPDFLGVTPTPSPPPTLNHYRALDSETRTNENEDFLNTEYCSGVNQRHFCGKHDSRHSSTSISENVFVAGTSYQL